MNETIAYDKQLNLCICTSEKLPSCSHAPSSSPYDKLGNGPLISNSIFPSQKQYRPLLEGLGLLTACGSSLLVFRIYFMGNKPPEFAPSDNPASDSESFLTRSLTYLHLPALNVWMLLCPKILSFDWSMEAIPLLESISDLRNIITVLFYSVLVYAAYMVLKKLEHESGSFDATNKKRLLAAQSAKLNNNDSPSFYHKQNGSNHSNGHSFKPKKISGSITHLQHASDDEGNVADFFSVPYRSIDIIVLALAIIIFPFIPASNMFFYVGFVIAERILYIPSMGFCLLIGLGLENLYNHFKSTSKRQTLYAGLVMLLLSFSAKTILRNGDWQTEEKLYSSGIKVNPAKAWGNLANVFNEKNETKKAENAYGNALKHRPNMADVHYNLGILLQNQNRLKEAIESYENAIRFRPKLTVAYLNLGILQANQGDIEKASNIYAKCAELDTSMLKDPRLHDKTKISCLFNLGRLLMDNNQNDRALEYFHSALKRRPDHYSPQSLYNMIGEVYFKQKKLNEAEKWYKKALDSKPDHVPAHLTMAKLLQAKGKPEEALEWYGKAKKLNPNDVSTDFHRAQFFVTSGRGSEAIKIYEEILPLSTNDFEIVYNAANVFREFGDQQKAEELYVKAVKLRPHEAAAQMNLGAMYHMNKKYDKAEETYLAALKLNPESQVTKDNLQRLRSLKANRKG